MVLQRLVYGAAPTCWVPDFAEGFGCIVLVMVHVALRGSVPVQNLLTPSHLGFRLQELQGSL